MGDEMNHYSSGVTEEEMIAVVRNIYGDDDMTEEDLRTAYRSGFLQELCPDIAQYHANTLRKGGEAKKDSDNESEKSNINTYGMNPGTSKKLAEDKVESHSKDRNIKTAKNFDEADSEHESVVSDRHNRHKKKKKKHSKDHKKRDREKEERKEKSRSNEDKEKVKRSKPPPSMINLDSSDSEKEKRRRDDNIKKEKKKRVVYVSSSSDDEADGDKHNNEQVIKVEKNRDKRPEKPRADDSKENGVPKVHPHYQDKSSNPGPSQPSTSTKETVETKREKTPERKKEPKPFSRYNRHASCINLKKWRPVLHKEHLRYQRKFRLKPVSVVCVDLLDFPMVFHPPRKHSKNPNAVPLSSGINLSQTRTEMIRRLERDKLNWFKSKLNRRALKSLKSGKHKHYGSSDEDDKKYKKSRLISSSDSNSDSSIIVPSKKSKKDQDDYKRSGGGGGSRKLSKSEKEAEARRRKLEEVKKKVDKVSNRGTRVLSWENKDQYFKSAKTKDGPQKEKDKAAAEKKRRFEQMRKDKLEQTKNAPSVSFQRILKQIETANKEQAGRPKVELKIPKKRYDSDRPVPISEYKLDGKIGVGDVYKEVTKLLSRNVLVECPVMPDPGDDLGEYTVKKIAWWILKNEKDPAMQGLYHPECHDDEDRESLHEDEFDWPSDVSSINGCVSDPEGQLADVPPDPKKVGDPDWADDYCGEASLYSRFRKQTQETKDKQFPIDSTEPFKSFLRIKPGTNYSKPNFEVKCFVCNVLLKGQRQFGAHIRSDPHKNNFRNYSLDMANYEEHLEYPAPRKVFVAKLVEYSANATKANSTSEKSDLSTETKHVVGKIERVRSDSPGPIVGGDAAPNLIFHQKPIPDDISIPSIEDYDISSDESLMNVRVFIRTAGKWNDELEKRWRTWRDEEAKIAQEYNAEREYFINEPERHPNYNEEWLNFWEKRNAELEAEGKDTENYNFRKDWFSFWLKRVQEILQAKVEQRVADLKRSLAIDKHTLRVRYSIPPGVTRRKKLKKKVGKMNEDDSSSYKTSDKVDSNENDPRRQPMGSADARQQYLNNVHSKPACLPTPPGTDEGRIRERGSSHISSDSQTKPSRKRKQSESESRSKNDKHCKSRDNSHNESHRTKRDGNDDRYDVVSNVQSSEHVSPKSPGSSNSRSKVSNQVNKTESVSSISSVEPAPPGEEPVLLDSSKTGPPPLPLISEPTLYKTTLESNKPIRNEFREKSRYQSAATKSDLNSHHNSKPNDNQHAFDRKSNEAVIVKSKHVTSWSDDSLDEELVKKRPRRESGDSSNSRNARTLQEGNHSLKAFHKDVRNTDTSGKKYHSDRPKVTSSERLNNNKQNLSDGEVASDVSDVNITAPKGVSTFVNKEIPGLGNSDKQIPSSSSLSKNSLGNLLLERKKSTDDHRNSNNSDRSRYEKRDDKYSKSYHHKDERHRKSKGHSSRNDDRGKQNNERRSSKDDWRRWDNNSKDNRHYNKDHRGHRDDNRGGSNHDNRNFSKHRGNYQPNFNNNQKQHNSTSHVPPPQPLFKEASWEPEDSWESTPTTPNPPPVPELSNQIPVLDSTTSRPSHQPYNNHDQYHSGTWNGVGWVPQTYPPPHMTDQSNYYY